MNMIIKRLIMRILIS